MIDPGKITELLLYNPRAPLIFSCGLFLFLFLGFTFFYRLLSRTFTLRIIYVILFSLYFYYKSSGIYFLLLILISVTDYGIGHFLYRSTSRKVKRWLVVLSLTVDLGILAYFKYTNFFIDTVNHFRTGDPLAFQNIFLPIGISFFIFQSLSYVIDLYRNNADPAKSWLDYLFFISFFPVLVAGPIIRAKDFIPQIYKEPFVTKTMFGEGFFLIAAGLFKKAVISDYISLNFVDRVFDNPLLYSGFENLMGVYGYALQIYCDFSGYSDMAIGIALLLGFKFGENFNSPYKSATITEFWRRWHISLSTWLRDYLYISLGGNRKGKLRTYVNLLITMLLGGLWHGASMRFVLWGMMHGVVLAVHKACMDLWPAKFRAVGAQMNPLRRAAGVFVTFNFVCFCWIFFRAGSMDMAFTVIRRIGTDFNARLIPEFLSGYKHVLILIVIGYMLHWLPDKYEIAAKRKTVDMPLILKSLGMTVLIWLVMQIKSSDIQPFIYFQF